jgi:glycine/D-amino acid oxidase-like deaminating enzyme
MHETTPTSYGEENIETTIIVGGGVIGLSTAYWLSQAKREREHNIIVLEAWEECFQDASGHNTGVLSHHWFSGHLQRLAEYSFGLYQDLAREKPSFRHTCGYHQDSLFTAHPGPNVSDPNTPLWLSVAREWHVDTEPPKTPSTAEDESCSDSVKPAASMKALASGAVM